MRSPYADLFRNQEQPELLPNELALHLGRATGYDHFRIHRALLAVNPVVAIVDGCACLTPADAVLVLQQADQDMIADAGVALLSEPTSPAYQLAA